LTYLTFASEFLKKMSVVVVRFKQDSAKERYDLDYKQYFQIFREQGELRTPNFYIEGVTPHDLRQLVFETHVTNVSLISKPSVTIINLNPLRALLSDDSVILILSDQSVLSEFELKLEECKLDHSPDSFYAVGLDAILSLAVSKMKAQIVERKEQVQEQGKHYKKFSARRLFLRHAQQQVLKLLDSVKRRKLVFRKILGDEQVMGFMVRLSNKQNLMMASPRTAIDDSDIQMLLESTEQSFANLEKQIGVFLNEIESEESTCSLENQLQETRLFLLNSAALLTMSTSTFGIFFAQIFSMNFPVPAWLGDGGTFTNSVPFNSTTNPFPTIFVSIVVVLSAIIVLGVSVLFTCFAKFGAGSASEE